MVDGRTAHRARGLTAATLKLEGTLGSLLEANKAAKNESEC